MQLKAEQLASHIQRSGPAPVYLISGDEPLQMTECADLVRAEARQQGFDERIVLQVETGFDWNTLLEESANLSLFSSRKIIELRLGNQKPGREGGKALLNYLEQMSMDNLLLITTARLEKQTRQSKWYKALDQAGITIQVWPIEIRQLPNWIQARVKQQGKQMERQAAEFLAQRVEGNLMAASQEIDKLCLLTEANTISMDDVLHAVVDSSRYDVFSLLESAYLGDLQRTARMLTGLQGEGAEPMAIYGAMMWEFRRLCSMAFQQQLGLPIDKILNDYRVFSPQRKQAIKMVLKRHDLQGLHELLGQAVRIDRTIKSVDKSLAWSALLSFLMDLAGAQLNLKIA